VSAASCPVVAWNEVAFVVYRDESITKNVKWCKNITTDIDLLRIKLGMTVGMEETLLKSSSYILINW
jgi:hypothetical protein